MNNVDLNNADNSRRSFLKKSMLTTASFAAADLSMFAMSPIDAKMEKPEVPWFKRITRWGQVNITEKDSLTYDIAWWRK